MSSVRIFVSSCCRRLWRSFRASSLVLLPCGFISYIFRSIWGIDLIPSVVILHSVLLGWRSRSPAWASRIV